MDKLSADFDERTTGAVSGAIDFTLAKWAGQEDIDQEMLMTIKPVFHSMILEFNFARSMGD